MVSLFPHPASFRFRLTTDTLAFGYLLPATGRIRVFHPLESCAAGRTQTGVVSLKRGNSFLVQKSIRTMKIRMLAVECNYHENKLASDRLYSNDEWISTDHAAGLRSKHREECTGETAQRRHGKDGLTPPYPDVKGKGCIGQTATASYQFLLFAPAKNVYTKFGIDPLLFASRLFFSLRSGISIIFPFIFLFFSYQL